jgi:chemotaxis protein CheC
VKRLDRINYTTLQLDVIKELANVGGGNAATSISQLINEPVSMTVPTIKILDYNEVFTQIMSEDVMVNSVIMEMTGSAEGMFLFITSDKVSEDLVNMMLPSGMDINDELRESAIKELVNILVTSYLNAIAHMVTVNLISSVPLLIKDMFGAILSSMYIEAGQYDDNVMIIRNEFLYKGDKIESSLYFVPKPGVLNNLFKILGVGEER